MANIKTRAVTEQEFKDIITTIRTGFILPSGQRVRSNEKISTALVLEANLGMRINDILKLRAKDIVFEGGRYHLQVLEQKTKKWRTFTVPIDIYTYIINYQAERGLKATQPLFDISPRAVQKHLKLVCEYLGLKGNISSHSFRKFYAQKIFDNNNQNIELVRELLQHSSIAISQHYIGVDSKTVETAIQNHIYLP